MVFSQQWCVFATGMHKIPHPPERCHIFTTPPRAHAHGRTHTRVTHTRTHIRAGTHAPKRKRTHPGAAAQARSFPPRKAKTKTNHPSESPKRITLSAKRITPNHRKNTSQRKNFKYVFFCFQCFSIFIR